MIPVFNERETIGTVLADWAETLRRTVATAVIAVIDDGSTDGTADRIQSLRARYPEIRHFPQANAGHGRACLRGYRLALEHGAPWVLQVDSDGQCDPRYFEAFWAGRSGSAARYGRRTQRDDGRLRKWTSAALGLLVRLCSGVRVPDPNVPYRLMSRESLRQAVPLIPDDVDLVNVYLAVLQQSRGSVEWIDIGFRKRSGGRTHYHPALMAAKASNVAAALLRGRRAFGGRLAARPGSVDRAL